MPQHSAGILLYRRAAPGIEILLLHFGGPFWRGKDAGAWSIPKGLCEPGETPFAAARREFLEETGSSVDGEATELGDFRQSGGKIITAFAIEGDFDIAGFKSNTFSVEWPPASGRMQEFPEADRAGWFSSDEALAKVTKGQVPIVRRLLEMLGG